MPTAIPLHPLFAARIHGVDIRQPLDAAWISDALDRWSVLVFPGQTITDEAQVAFSEIFGPLETTRAGANGAGGKLIVLTNIGPDGQIGQPSDKQVLNNKANQFWHHDSSFKTIPARASILSAREIPSAGGDTAFCSMRAAWNAMPEAMQATARDRIAIHDFGWSRARVDPALITETERTGHPPVERAVLATENPNGPALYLGQHARSIKGLDDTGGRALIDGLMAHATDPDFIYSHRWQQGDVVVWDNRAVMHRATPFAASQERRHMVRTTASCLPAIH